MGLTNAVYTIAIETMFTCALLMNWSENQINNAQIKLAPTVVKGAQFNQTFCTKIRFLYGVNCDIRSLLSDSGVSDTIRSYK